MWLKLILSSSKFPTFPALRIIYQIVVLDFRPVQQVLTRVAALNAQFLGFSRRREQMSARLHKFLLLEQIALHLSLTNIWTVLVMLTITLARPWRRLHLCLAWLRVEISHLQWQLKSCKGKFTLTKRTNTWERWWQKMCHLYLPVSWKSTIITVVCLIWYCKKGPDFWFQKCWGLGF